MAATTAHIIGLGDSAEGWGCTADRLYGNDFSVGVNDAEKWDYRCDYLALFNHPTKFRKEPDRMKTMIESRPKKVYTHAAAWKNYFPNVQMVSTTQFNVRIKKGWYYSLKTSPIVAMSVAWALDADTLVLWGVDLKNHKTYRPGNKYYDKEVAGYLRFIEQLNKQGVKVFVGAEGSVFCDHIPMWTPPWKETAHLLSTKANEERLTEGIKQAEGGDIIVPPELNND